MKKKDTRMVLCEASGPLKTLLDNLSGDEGEFWLTSLKRMLRKESPFARDWQVWMSIQTKIYSSIEMLYEAIEKQQGRKDFFVKRNDIKTEASETLKLVVVTLENLGFSHGANLKAICKQAILLGLSLCPDDLPWQLRLEYTDQPIGEQLHIATKTTFPGGVWGNPCVAVLGRRDFSGVSAADTVNRQPHGDSFHYTDKFVFCLRN